MLENLNSYLDDPIDGNKQDDEVEIDLLEIFNVLKSKFLILLTAGLLVGCLCGLFTKFVMTPVYTSTSSILVLSKETTLTSLADIQLGTSLTSDYTVLIKCTPVLEQVIKNLDLDMDSDALRKNISIENPSDSRILEISVQNTDPEQAKKMAGLSDGAIVGSAVVKRIAKYGKDSVPYVAEYVKEMKQAVREA